MTDLKLHSGEHIILSLRKHPLIAFGQLIPFIVLDYLPYLLPKAAAFAEASAPAITFSPAAYLSFGNPWFDFIVGIYWLFVWMGAFGVFTNYFLDQWIVTNERIIDINQKTFWYRDVSSLFLDRVQNVETETGGFFGTLFGFGTVSIESAGAEIGKVRMAGLSHPNTVRDTILKEVGKLHKQAPAKEGV